MYLASPLNYVGGKYKLLPQLLPLIPDDISDFVDLFCGGCNVAVNVTASGKKYCNDIEEHVIDFYKNIQNMSSEDVIKQIEKIISEYNLSKTNQEGYLKCRKDYNITKKWDLFYSLVCHSFNHQIRFNKSGGFNMPFGTNRSNFNTNLKEKLIGFVDILDSNYIFTNKDFRLLNYDFLDSKSFIYVDSPYLITNAVYNETNRLYNGWTEKDEFDLFTFLDYYSERGLRFMMSNVLEDKGKVNELLLEWSKKYKLIDLNHSYGNSNYKIKDKSKDSTREVLIINY